jgi:hypothetical protein
MRAVTEPPRTEFQQIEMSDDAMRARIAAAESYTLVLISAGPEYRSADARSIVWEHGRRNMRLSDAGVMPIVCPVRDDTPLCGIAIMATSVERAAALMDGDPGVQAGVFTYELHPVSGSPGSTL